MGTGVSPLLNFPMKKILLALSSLLLCSTAHAQWKTTTYTLKTGWNAIYLAGDATQDTIDNLFPATVLEVWRWQPNSTAAGFTQSPLIPSSGTAEWATWKRDGSVTSLSTLVGQSAYLVKCSAAANVMILQSPRLPSTSWVRNGANLLGFPSFKSGSTYPTMSAYFSTFPAAITGDSKIYKYVGGDLGAGNPMQVFSPTTDRVDATQAYWFSAEVTGSFYAPLEISPSTNGGLAFGRDGSVIKLLVRNRSAAAAVTLTLTPTASESAPSGQTPVAGVVPLTKRSYDAATMEWTQTPIAAAYTEVVPPSSSVELYFGIDRSTMTGATDALYASLLRITDNSLVDVFVPVTAQKASLAGLWVGDVSLTNVSSKVSNGAHAKATVENGVVTAVTVDGAGGYGYSAAPVVTIAPPFANANQGATATATLGTGADAGKVVSVTQQLVGSGYVTPPLVTISAPNKATFVAVRDATTSGVASITPVLAGSNYTAAALPTVFISAPPASVNSVATATMSGGAITGIKVNTPGSCYLNSAVPTVSVAAPPDSIPATATGTVTPASSFWTNNLRGAESMTVINGGTNYVGVPAVTAVLACGTEKAYPKATAVMGLTVQSFTISSGTRIYSVAPTVTITGGGASTQATAFAILTDGLVTDIWITDPGAGYTSAPSIAFTDGTIIASNIAPTAVGNAAQFKVVSINITDQAKKLWLDKSLTLDVTIAAPPAAVQATATATVVGGAISAINVGTAGTGYTAAPAVAIDAPPAPVQAVAVASYNGAGSVTCAVTNTGRGYLSAPTVTVSDPTGAAANTAKYTANLVNNAVSSYTMTSAGSGYTSAPTVTVGPPPANAGAVATATIVNGSATKFTLTNGGSGYLKAPAVSISAPPPGTGGSTTPTPFKLRTLIHVSDAARATLLSQVYLGQLAVAPNAAGVCTSESLLKQDALASAQRLGAAHLPPGTVATSTVAMPSTISSSVSIPYSFTIPFNGATNPFVHAYHPDHDNKDARGNPLGAGVESPSITRTCTFTFTPAPPDGSVIGGWGSSVIGGTYSELIYGLHKEPFNLTGTFQLRRASQIGTLSQ